MAHRLWSRVLLTLNLSLITSICAFNPIEATISSTHRELFTGLTTCREVVSSFLSRIEALNHHTNAIISLNPHALDIGAALDIKLESNKGSFGPLFCIPTLLKDNFDTEDMPTTGGNKAMAKSQPSSDAPIVKAIKDAGAIIIGKTNLHELALEGITVSSLGGQTINPYDSTRTPGGSSGGTGAAIAASFAVWGTGTDTVNSLRSPASANSLFSCRPTRGLISRAGVIPASFSQDTVGPIGRCVHDVAVALSVMASVGVDRSDNVTLLAPVGIHDVNYAASLENSSLKGFRLGVLEGFFNRLESNETTPVNDAMDETIQMLRSQGTTIVSISDGVYNATTILELDVQRYEYRQMLESYLQNPTLKGPHPHNLQELYSTNDFLLLPSQYNFAKTALASSTSNTSYTTTLNKIDNLTHTLHEMFRQNQLDALIYPQQKNLVVPLGSPSQAGRNGILAALTGSPVITVPIGFSPATETAKDGIPIGMEILGMPWTEELLLKIAAGMEMLRAVRRSPRWAVHSFEAGVYQNVPRIVPDVASIPVEYPVGVME
ncbi:Hypothetical protein R9X50_00517100 [Acrodontium crateriforme]|uniref:Amidase domain-containing protein n=1 Tax=Acrodontium crateriforme TaxID=150365 RepID=A0AAQ3R8Y0_9PEZI|nr:Hypothetical protein R9X50_00517100 [Acrodontium crateriforme]